MAGSIFDEPNSTMQPKAETQLPEDPAVDMRANPEKYIEVKLLKSYRDGFGTVGMHDVELTNKATIDYKDIELRFTYFSKSQATLDNKTYAIYDILPAGTKKKFNDLNTGFLNEAVQIDAVSVYVKRASVKGKFG
ncbi:MAG: hypothetical protein WC304_03760 [Candidatus Gracilibacteria bacterium]